MPNLYEGESGVIRALVDRLGHDLEPSILIGGWATFVRVGGEISLDIDLITSQESRHKLEKLMTDLSPSNNHLPRTTCWLWEVGKLAPPGSGGGTGKNRPRLSMAKDAKNLIAGLEVRGIGRHITFWAC